MYSCIKTKDTLEIILNGKPYSVHQTHKDYDEVLAALRSNDEQKLDDVVSRKTLTNLVQYVAVQNEGIVIHEGVVTCNGVEVHGTMVDRLLEHQELGLDIKPISQFIMHVMENPTRHVVNDLYTFLEYGKLPLTSDGHFLAYKVVRHDYKDKHSGSIDNSVGQIVKMPRNQVDDNRNNTCSSGLHFCSFEYIDKFLSSGGDRIVLVKVNPKNVVSIPPDYNNTKARCCEYEVIEDVTEKMEGKHKAEQVLRHPVMDDSYSEYDYREIEEEIEEMEEEHEEDDTECVHCGSTNLQSRGTETRSGGRLVRRYRCNDCTKNTYVEE